MAAGRSTDSEVRRMTRQKGPARWPGLADSRGIYTESRRPTKPAPGAEPVDARLARTARK